MKVKLHEQFTVTFYSTGIKWCFESPCFEEFWKYNGKHSRQNPFGLVFWPKPCMFIKSSQRGCSVKKVVLNNFANFTGKHLRWSLYLITLQKTCNFIKKIIQHRCFPGKFAKFLRTPILKNIGERLLLPLLKVHSSTALISPDQRYFQITTFSCFPRWAMPISNVEPEFSVKVSSLRQVTTR